MKPAEEKRYENLSPFELKNKLIALAETHHERMMLNAGRGNPNWVALVPREGFFLLGLFALAESGRKKHRPGLGGVAENKGIARRLGRFLDRQKKKPGGKFLKQAVAYAVRELKIKPDELVGEFVDAILGDHYPEPDRILNNVSKIIHRYLEKEMFGRRRQGDRFDLFATEGGTAAMDYIFSTLMENHLLHKGDTIALGTPIFTPYLEIPRLNDYKFIELEVKQDENKDWQYPDKEIAKLANPKVKAFFIVNPANPASVSIAPESLKKIGRLVRQKRKDLIILTDDVYGTFVNNFKSLAAYAPKNAILVYSYSKYFGATGWRLGVIAIHEKNVFDQKIKKFPRRIREQLYRRYERVILDPNKMKLIERMVADSRSVALHHTAGLSTPQQVLMALFSLSQLIDRQGKYKKLAQSIVRRRIELLYRALGVPYRERRCDAHYYSTIDVPKLARQRYGADFEKHLLADHEPIDFVVRLAEEKSVVLMDGGGFDAPNMSVRVSLANLPDQNYTKIGRAISQLLAEYYRRYRQGNLKRGKTTGQSGSKRGRKEPR